MPRRPSATVMQPALAAVALLLPLLSLAAPALAGTSPPGVNLRWDQCFGDGGAWNKDFACNINTGFDLATDLAGARNLAEVMQLQATCWRKLLGELQANQRGRAVSSKAKRLV